MNILDKIVENKRKEVLRSKRQSPLSAMSSKEFYRRNTNAVRLAETGARGGIIAEFKRRSPSRGLIHPDAEAVNVALAYEQAGAAAMSILTDRDFFGGSLSDLEQVRRACPELVLLRKDFMVDPYQLHEASAHGADMVLLIAAVLDISEVEDLTLEADSLGLQVLFEIHHQRELEKFHPKITLVGVNNRDLKTFHVDTARSLELIKAMPEGVIPVSESGLSDPGEVRKLERAGFRFFLMGENFMKEKDPGEACRKFIQDL
jgi:indole-3-glycerol phosphate synthase